MKISTEIGSIAKKVGLKKAVELCGKAGFDAWDFSMFEMCRLDRITKKPLPVQNELNGPDYVKAAKELKRIGESYGMVCNQSHAPFPTNSPDVCSFLKRSIECTAIAGGEICIIHPDNYKTAEENAPMFLELLPFAKQYGVKIATENMWLWDKEKNESAFAACATAKDFVKHLDAINDEDFVACLDIGHAEMRGSGDGAVKMIRALGSRLKALHIHDNDRWHDSHQIPFSMEIDFVSVLKALKEVDYKGYFTLEADTYLNEYTPDNILSGIIKLKESAKRLSDMFNEL